MQRLTLYSHPLRIIWQEPPVGRLLQGATPVYAKTLISRLFTLCAQAHSAAASLLLFPQEEPDMQAAQRELARETLRRALTDWLPIFSQRQATVEEWALLRRGDLSSLASTIFFADDPHSWLAAGVQGWEAWFLQGHSDAARWLAALQSIVTPTLPIASSPDQALITHGPLDVSPLAIEYPLLSACCLSGKNTALRLLARCITLARSLSALPTLRWNRFDDGEWKIAVVETARGWLVHQARLATSGNILDYRIISPTTRHAQSDGVIACELAAIPASLWSRQLQVIDPCVAINIIE
ncbi:ATP/GTP-binding protein [Salmonella enterica]|nr:ATP/GTP-binding protein [Salmonella enterica]EGS2521229.1 ATP/GTP-binding protein [Salmonella enterica]EHA6887065.1 ATP/GTP-binding protein [Salmonella enterica]ELD4901785.1 ATP/GTP-binding protein [Salmonella enterica]ELQ8151191.1 ATP/GTP-binding protein [Salmonella enterica]